MEEEKKTPEQEEMEVYEKYIEKFGAVEVVGQLATAISLANPVFMAASELAKMSDKAFRESGAKAPLRGVVAGLQVYLNMMELLIGDTAEEEYVVIQSLSEEIYAAENIR